MCYLVGVIFTIITHPIFPGQWKLIDEDGRTHGQGSLLDMIERKVALEARLACGA